MSRALRHPKLFILSLFALGLLAPSLSGLLIGILATAGQAVMLALFVLVVVQVFAGKKDRRALQGWMAGATRRMARAVR